MTTIIVLILVASALVFAVAIWSLVDLLRHDGPGNAGRLPRSHHADAFDPYAQRFGPHAA